MRSHDIHFIITMASMRTDGFRLFVLFVDVCTCGYTISVFCLFVIWLVFFESNSLKDPFETQQFVAFATSRPSAGCQLCVSTFENFGR